MGETSTTSLSMRCFTLKRVLGQCAAPAPTPVLHLRLPCLLIIFSWAGSRCLSQIFWPRRVRRQGNRNETRVFYQLSCQQGPTSDIFPNPGDTFTLEGCRLTWSQLLFRLFSHCLFTLTVPPAFFSKSPLYQINVKVKMWEIVSAADIFEQKRPIIFKSRFSSALFSINALLYVLCDISISKNMINRIEKLPK